MYTFSIKLSFSSKGQNKLQKQISKILISTVMAAWYSDSHDVKDYDIVSIIVSSCRYNWDKYITYLFL